MSVPNAAAQESPFWRFSLSFYRQPGVADACIELQDRCGVDVNLLLFLLWLAAMQRRVTVTQVKELDAKIREWRNFTIIPLRTMRRALKVDAPLVTAARAELFRTRIKAAELEAERLQQEALYDFAQSSALGTPASPADAARSNFVAYQSMQSMYFPKQASELLLETFGRIDHAAFAPGTNRNKKSQDEQDKPA